MISPTLIILKAGKSISSFVFPISLLETRINNQIGIWASVSETSYPSVFVPEISNRESIILNVRA